MKSALSGIGLYVVKVVRKSTKEGTGSYPKPLLSGVCIGGFVASQSVEAPAVVFTPDLRAWLGWRACQRSVPFFTDR